VRAVGCAIIGQTSELAPADRRLYAIRDVTATVDSIPLVTASILGKKLAAGIGALVMDVKVGGGSLLPTHEAARALAESLHAVAADSGLPMVSLLTEMSQALGHHVGNALEVREAVEFLTGHRRHGRLHAVTTALAGELLVLGGLAGDQDRACAAVERALASGAAAERFARMVTALGGPTDLIERPDRHLARAPVRTAVAPGRPGFVTGVDARALGLLVAALGGGRRRADDPIDPAVGLEDVAGVGDEVDGHRPLAVVHARSRDDAEMAAASLRAAITLGDRCAPLPSPVLERIAAGRTPPPREEG
jgi:thymidine phosphorylase